MPRTPSYMINQQGRCKYDLPKSSSEFIRDSQSTIQVNQAGQVNKIEDKTKNKKKD